MATPDPPGTSARPPKARRSIFIFLLILLFGTLALATFGTAHHVLEPLGSVPPNRYVDWTKGMDLAARVTGFFEMLWWAFAILLGGIALLTWKGSFDRLLVPLIAIALLACLAAGCLAWYVFPFRTRSKRATAWRSAEGSSELRGILEGSTRLLTSNFSLRTSYSSLNSCTFLERSRSRCARSSAFVFSSSRIFS